MARRPDGEKRRRILDAAATVFARKGYFVCRVSDVAKAAGVADGTIYLYFKNKEDVLLSLFADVLDRHLADAKAEIEGVEGPRDKLLAIARHHLVALSERREVGVLFQTELRQSARLLSKISSEKLKGYFDVLSGVIDEGQRTGAFRPEVDRRIVTRAFFGALDELVTAWIIAEKPYDLVAQAEPLVGLFLNGLAPRASTPLV
jgi:TetR/AcrR family fatty acid metabolism transcriptional regulator